MEVLDKSAGKEFLTFFDSIAAIVQLQRFLGHFWSDVRQIITLPPNTSYVAIRQDKSMAVGMPFIEERILPIGWHIYINMERDHPYKGGWLLLYGYDEETKQFFYWTTKMVTVFHKGNEDDFAKTSEFSRLSIFNASGRRGIGITSSNN